MQSSTKIKILIASAFGPQLFPAYGVYAGHIVIYFFLLLEIVPLVLLNLRCRYSSFIKFPLLMWGSIIVIAILSTLANTSEMRLKTIASIDNYIQPFAVLLVVDSFSRKLRYNEVTHVLHSSIILLVFLLTLNSIIVISTALSIKTYWITKYFFRHESGISVDVFTEAFNDQMGRYTGIFNTPFESGLTYVLVILCLLFVYSRSREVKLWWYLALLINSLAGILSGSKVFIIVGVGLFIFYASYSNTLRKFFKDYILYFMVLVFMICFIYILTYWKGFDYILRFINFSSSSDFFSSISGGRLTLTSEGSSFLLFYDIYLNHHYFGHGFLSTTYAFDNSLLEIYYQGGVLSVLIYLTTILGLYVFVYRSDGSHALKGVLYSFIFLIVVAGLGAPVLTANRVSVIMIMLMYLFSSILERECKYNNV